MAYMIRSHIHFCLLIHAKCLSVVLKVTNIDCVVTISSRGTDFPSVCSFLFFCELMLFLQVWATFVIQPRQLASLLLVAYLDGCLCHWSREHCVYFYSKLICLTTVQVAPMEIHLWCVKQATSSWRLWGIILLSLENNLKYTVQT